MDIFSDLILRDANISDSKFLLKLYNDEDAMKYLYISDKKVNEKDIKEGIVNYKKEDNDYKIICTFELTGDRINNEPVGYLLVSKLAHDPKIGWISYNIAKEHRGNNYAEKAIKTYLSEVEKEKWRRIETFVVESNIASMKALLKNGFKREGIFRKRESVDGKYVDSHWFGLLFE